LLSSLPQDTNSTVVKSYTDTKVSEGNVRAETKIESTVNGETYTFESSSPGKYKLEMKSVEGGKSAVTIESEAADNLEGVVRGVEKEAKKKIEEGSNKVEKEIEERSKEMKLTIKERVEKIFSKVVDFFKNLFSF